MTSANKYVQELSLNVRSNHPVTLVYSEDLFDTLELTYNAIPLIRPDTDKILYWSASSGWLDLNEREKKISQQMSVPTRLELTTEMRKTTLSPIFASPERLGGARKPIFIVSLLSAKFKKDLIEAMQELRDFDYLTRNGINEPYRLIILANKSFEITSDYENLFGVIYHDPPVKEELQEVFQERFIKDFVSEVVSKVYNGDTEELINQLNELEDYVLNTVAGLTERQARLALVKSLSQAAIRDGRKVASFDIDKFKEYLFKRKFDDMAASGSLKLLRPYEMDQVGGLELLKQWTTERAFAFTEEAQALGVKRPKGALLIGLPGTGKSLIARAMGNLLNRPTVQFDISAVFGRYVGDSEGKMREALKQIEAVGSCILFIDEIDKVFSNNGGELNGGTTTRVLGYLLTWLQEATTDVFVVMTANRIQNIPPELLRKGRFDEIFYVALPNEEERLEILQIHLKRYNVEMSLQEVANRSNGFSSSELEYIVNEAALKAAYKRQEFSPSHMIDEIKATTPMSVAFREDMIRMADWARTNAKPASKEITYTYTDANLQL